MVGGRPAGRLNQYHTHLSRLYGRPKNPGRTHTLNGLRHTPTSRNWTAAVGLNSSVPLKYNTNTRSTATAPRPAGGCVPSFPHRRPTQIDHDRHCRSAIYRASASTSITRRQGKARWPTDALPSCASCLDAPLPPNPPDSHRLCTRQWIGGRRLGGIWIGRWIVQSQRLPPDQRF